MLNIMNPPADWSTLKKLIWLRGTPITGGEELTVTGTPPLSLTNSLGKPLKAWSVDVLPKQDLNGYDAPWPAGGGVNKLKQDFEVGGISSQTGGDAPQTNTLRGIGYNKVTAGESYYLKGTGYLFYYANADTSTYNGNSGGYISNAVVTIPVGVNYVRIQLHNSYGTTYNYDVALNNPSSITSWSPYSNICPIHGTDKVTIYTDSKYGGLVEWNQLIKNGNFESTTNWGASNATTSASDNILTITKPKNTPYGTGYAYQYVQLIANHKYLTAIDYKADEYTTSIRVMTDNSTRTVSDTNWHTIQSFYQSSSNQNYQMMVWNLSTNTENNMVLQICNAMVFDLTAMFGAGNEPSTVEEFRALFPKDYYAYNAGQQMTVDQVNGAQYSPAVITLPSTVYTATIGSDGGESRTGCVTIVKSDVASVAVDGDNLRVYLNNNKLSVISGYKSGRCNKATFLTSWSDVSGNANGIAVNSPATKQFIVNQSIASDLQSTLDFIGDDGLQIETELATHTTFAVPSVTIPTPTGTATTWATAEDGTVDSMEVTYVGKA